MKSIKSKILPHRFKTALKAPQTVMVAGAGCHGYIRSLAVGQIDLTWSAELYEMWIYNTNNTESTEVELTNDSLKFTLNTSWLIPDRFSLYERYSSISISFWHMEFI